MDRCMLSCTNNFGELTTEPTRILDSTVTMVISEGECRGSISRVSRERAREREGKMLVPEYGV